MNHTLWSLAQAFKSGSLTPSKVVEEALSKSAQYPHTFISLHTQYALEQAHLATQRWQNNAPLSPLDGIPISWKDLFDIKDTVTTAGSKLLARLPVAQSNSALVDIVSAQGLIALGKTNLTEFAFSGVGLNPHFGTPTNPLLDSGQRIPGGSSSGAAIAIATDCVPLSVGTDTAGSIRIPAALNGLVGYRSSSNRYPKQGVFPLSITLDALGPIANTVADCIIFDAVASKMDISTVIQQLRTHTLPTTRVNTIVVDTELLKRYSVSQEVLANYEQSIERLSAQGVSIINKKIDSLHATHELIHTEGWLGSIEAFQLHQARLDSSDAEIMDPLVRSRLETYRGIPASQHQLLLQRRSELQAQLRRELNHDLVLLPTVAHTAPTIAECLANYSEVNGKTLALTMLGSFLDCPSVSLPNGTDTQGLPTGVQLMGSTHDDESVLSTAYSIECILNPNS